MTLREGSRTSCSSSGTTSAGARPAAAALKKGQAGLIAVYSTNMADQDDRDHKSLVDASHRNG